MSSRRLSKSDSNWSIRSCGFWIPHDWQVNPDWASRGESQSIMPPILPSPPSLQTSQSNEERWVPSSSLLEHLAHAQSKYLRLMAQVMKLPKANFTSHAKMWYQSTYFKVPFWTNSNNWYNFWNFWCHIENFARNSERAFSRWWSKYLVLCTLASRLDCDDDGNSKSFVDTTRLNCLEWRY